MKMGEVGMPDEEDTCPPAGADVDMEVDDK